VLLRRRSGVSLTIGNGDLGLKLRKEKEASNYVGKVWGAIAEPVFSTPTVRG